MERPVKVTGAQVEPVVLDREAPWARRPSGGSVRRRRSSASGSLVPTNHERLVWGQGDGRGLTAVETGFGRLGGLICWENYMPLARVALYEAGVEIYVASTEDNGGWQATLVHIARASTRSATTAGRTSCSSRSVRKLARPM